MMNCWIKIIGVLSCVLPMMAHATPHSDYLEEHVPTLINKLKQTEFPGPLAEDLAVWSTARQILEDGLSKSPDTSCAGISIGGKNKEIASDVLLNSNIDVSSATDAEGGRFYYFRGEGANIFSSHIVARLFDLYVYQFLKRHKHEWHLIKETSRAIHQEPDSFELRQRYHCQLNPDKILQDCNSIYGPGSPAVKQIIQQYQK